MSREIRTAIIGVGNMGGTHAQNIYSGKVPGLRLAALCDNNAERAEYLRKQFEVPVWEDYREMLKQEQLDAVIIATPHYLHCGIAEYAIKSGLHVLSEKPIGVMASEAKHMVDVSKQTDRVYCVMLNQRTNKLFAKAREMVAAGELGELKRSVWIITNWYRTQAYYNSGGWRGTWDGEGGGVLMNQAPHNLDLWQWIVGMPVKVTANCEVAKYHNIEVEDEAVISVVYENGATGLFVTSTGEYPGTNRLEISGTKGKLVVEDGLLKFWRLEQDEAKFRFESEENFANIPYIYSEIKDDTQESGHIAILKNFAAAILDGEKLISPGSDALNEITLANAAYLSSWKNKTVTLPLNYEEFDEELAAKRKQSVMHGAESASDAPINSEYSERWQVRW